MTTVIAHCVSLATVIFVPSLVEHYATRYVNNKIAMRRIRRNIRAQQQIIYS